MQLKKNAPLQRKAINGSITHLEMASHNAIGGHRRARPGAAGAAAAAPPAAARARDGN
jgi:hypothetical protein